MELLEFFNNDHQEHHSPGLARCAEINVEELMKKQLICI